MKNPGSRSEPEARDTEVKVSDPEQDYASAIDQLAMRMLDVASMQATHQIVLEALIKAYTTVAVSHPCCTQQSVLVARQVADVIEKHACDLGAAVFH